MSNILQRGRGRKAIPTLLSCLMLWSMLLPAAAETTDLDSSTSENKSQSVDVYATKAASFAVKVPVSITLEQSNGAGTADYSIYIKGDVEDGSSVTVGPESTSISFQKTKGNTATTLTGSVVQAETSVAAADISTAYPATGQLSGSISVSGITAGQWKGQMTFAVGYTGGASDTPLNATAEMDKVAMQAAAKKAPAVTFAKKAAAPSGTASSVDVSAAKDGSVMAHTLSDGSVVIGADGGVLAPADMSNAFYYFSAASIDCTGLDTRNVTNMSCMFQLCRNFTSLDVSNFDTQNVTNMSEMFKVCSGLISLDLSNFNTNNVEDMSQMFASCSNLTSLDLSNFDTQNVTNMSEMFSSCISLASLDISSFNTQNVTNMSEMFSSCNSLTSLDISSFNTQSVTDMHYMFNNCPKLTSLDVSNFNTSNVNDMNNMFLRCSGLTSLDLSNFDTSNVTDMNNMFNNCSGLTTLNINGFDVSKVTNSGGMFWEVYEVSIYVSDANMETWVKSTYIPSYATVIVGSPLITLSTSPSSEGLSYSPFPTYCLW